MAPGVAGEVGTVRNPIVALVVSFCCGLPFVYYLWVLPAELRDFTRKEDINPLLFILPVIQLLQVWTVGEKVLEAKRMAGIANPQVASPVLYLLLFPWAMITDLNEIWEARGAGQQPAPPQQPALPG
jgi:hypothetical protein